MKVLVAVGWKTSITTDIRTQPTANTHKHICLVSFLLFLPRAVLDEMCLEQIHTRAAPRHPTKEKQTNDKDSRFHFGLWCDARVRVCDEHIVENIENSVRKMETVVGDERITWLLSVNYSLQAHTHTHPHQSDQMFVDPLTHSAKIDEFHCCSLPSPRRQCVGFETETIDDTSRSIHPFTSGSISVDWSVYSKVSNWWQTKQINENQTEYRHAAIFVLCALRLHKRQTADSRLPSA